MEQNQIIIYQTEDGQTQIDVRMENETVWLTQAQMAELFRTDRTSMEAIKAPRDNFGCCSLYGHK